jgi:hypothetical protein
VQRRPAEIVVLEGLCEIVRVARRLDAQGQGARKLVAAFVKREPRTAMPREYRKSALSYTTDAHRHTVRFSDAGLFATIGGPLRPCHRLTLLGTA